MNGREPSPILNYMYVSRGLRQMIRLWLTLAMMIIPSYGGVAAKLIILGSGTPIPDPESSGPAVAIVVNGQAYLFDAGAGVVRRASAAAGKYQLAELEAPNLNRLFFTHLHTDHTLGYPDMIFTPWVVGRETALEVFGPKGTEAMTGHLKEAYSEDIAIRTGGFEHLSLAGLRVNVHEMSPGPIYQDANISVTAIPVCHGSWPHAFGFSVNAAGRTIVMSGDTAPCQPLTNACHGCDVLLHEVYSSARFARFSPAARQYHSAFHTSTRELADIATACKPKLLVLYHQLYFGPKEGVDLEAEIRQFYTGKVVNGVDLGMY